LTGLCAGVVALGGPPQAAEDKKAEAKVQVGKPAPEVELPAAQIEKALPDKKDAKTLNLKEFQGKKNVVLFFFPKAFTGG
jgi:peroxiredoxin